MTPAIRTCFMTTFHRAMRCRSARWMLNAVSHNSPQQDAHDHGGGQRQQHNRHDEGCSHGELCRKRGQRRFPNLFRAMRIPRFFRDVKPRASEKASAMAS